METKKDYSYGVIPLLKMDHETRVFLIHQYGYAGDVYWTFPKGHKEEGETSKEAALRELFEETGITADLFEEKQYMQQYVFVADGVTVEKTVEFFVGYAQSEAYTLQEEEVKEAGWFSFTDAYQKLSFEPSKSMLKEVERDHHT